MKKENEETACDDVPECKHEFTHVVYKTQELEVNSYGLNVRAKGIVEKENVKIYCIKCGTSMTL